MLLVIQIKGIQSADNRI